MSSGRQVATHASDRRGRRSRVASLARAMLLLLWCSLCACSTTYPRVDPTGETFPSVLGTSLANEPVRVPEDFAGAPALLLIGYEQDAQFDADRWLLGLLQAEVDIAVRELPTIPGFVPRLLSGRIDEGMRQGIPREDWGAVVTVYADAARIARFTGNERGNNMRIVLLDGAGQVVFFHDRGYSAGTLVRLLEVIERLDA